MIYDLLAPTGTKFFGTSGMLSLTDFMLFILCQLAVVDDARFARDDIVRNHGAAHAFAQLDLRLVRLKLAAPHQHGAAFRLQRKSPFVLAVPLHESAVAEPDRSA